MLNSKHSTNFLFELFYSKFASIPIVALTNASTVNSYFQYMIKFFSVFFLLFILLLFIKNFFKIDLIKFRFILGLVIFIYHI
jgi:hypothetical protein